MGHLLEALLVFEDDDCFTTFPYERRSSVSANARVLEALAHRPEAFPTQLAKIEKHLLAERRDGAWWQDKWHVSPYYATATAVFALHRAAGSQSFEDARRWLVETQRPDGSWGVRRGTVEEITYAVLGPGRRGPRHPGPLRAAHEWLRRWGDDAGPELWIGKGLYTPRPVVRAAVLAARAVSAHHLGSKLPSSRSIYLRGALIAGTAR